MSIGLATVSFHLSLDSLMNFRASLLKKSARDHDACVSFSLGGLAAIATCATATTHITNVIHAIATESDRASHARVKAASIINWPCPHYVSCRASATMKFMRVYC